MSLPGPLGELLAEVIPQEARRTHRAYRLVPVEDLEQEMWVKAVAIRDRLVELLLDGKHGTIRLKMRDAALRAVKEDQRYRRAVKAASAGYRAEDEQFYSVRALRAALPLYLDQGVTERPPRGRDLTPPSHGDAAEGGTYLAIMLDIDRAFKAVKSHHAHVLTRYFAYPQGPGGWTHEEISSAMGIEPTALKRRVYRALRAMQDTLGGKSPWTR